MASASFETEAFLLASYPLKEADRLIECFTENFGLIRAVAKSAREERSKLRYALEPLSRAQITLVRGRDVWRIRGAQHEESLYRTFADSNDKLRLVGNTFLLLRRLIAGEEENVPLYRDLSEALAFLRSNLTEAEEVKAFESILVLRILSRLGYRLPRDDWQHFLTEALSKSLTERFMSHRRAAVLLINETLAESQL